MSCFDLNPKTVQYAPACVCGLASRMILLRRKVRELPEVSQRALNHLLTPLPFEQELLSGKIDQVELAIQKIGEIMGARESEVMDIITSYEI